MSRRLRATWRRVCCLVRTYRRTFPLAPDDMRLAYGHRRALLVGLAVVAVAGLGARLFATELFRSRVSRDLLLVVGFNLALTGLAAVGAVGYRRARAWCRACRRRLGALRSGGPRRL